MLRKNIKNERGAVQHLDLLAKGPFQFALMSRAELVVKQYNARILFVGKHSHLFHLT